MALSQVITNGGINVALDRTFRVAPTMTAFTKFGVGTVATTVDVTDTALGGIVAINGGNYKTNTSETPDTGNKNITIQSVLAYPEANGNSIKEYGLFNTDGTPVLGAHVVFSVAGQSKTASVQLVFLSRIRRTP